MRMQHVDTAKGQCEAVICPGKEVKGKRIGVKRNRLWHLVLLCQASTLLVCMPKNIY